LKTANLDGKGAEKGLEMTNGAFCVWPKIGMLLPAFPQNLTAVLLWGLSSEQGFSSFVFLSLKVVLVFPVWLRFLFFGSWCLALHQSAIRTRRVSVPDYDSKSVKRNEAHPIYKTGSAS